ncbi:hypothetical protein CHISP_1907 [Chitinispirillum alkaliphilum]|nr:hypothetical protein CHISP_1907 [Chitinispirillum alkaliphilum]
MFRGFHSLITASILSILSLYRSPDANTVEFHRGPVSSISSDREGNFLLTTSFDNTARLWSVDGEFIQLISSDSQKPGAIFTSAVSECGNWFAFGGWKAELSGKSFYVSLYSFKSGGVVFIWKDLGASVMDLKFCGENRVLAAGLKSGGIVLIDVMSREIKGRLRGYGGSVYSLDFSSQNKLVSADSDGVIRLYDRDLTLISILYTGSGRTPCSVRFSPDGAYIALGFEKPAQVEIVQTENLGVKATLTLSENDTRDGIVLVGWSNTGQEVRGVYTSADDQIRGNIFVWKWESGEFRRRQLGAGLLLDAKTLSDNTLIFSGMESEFGRVDSSGLRMIFHHRHSHESAVSEKPNLIIHSPSEGDTLLDSLAMVTFSSKEAPFLDLQVYVNGIQQTTRFMATETSGAELHRTLLVSLSPGVNSVRIVAKHRDGKISDSFVSLHRNVRTNRNGYSRGSLFSLSVGIESYKNRSLEFIYAERDSRRFHSEINSQRNFGLYTHVHSRLLTNYSVTRSSLTSEIDWLALSADSNDVVLIYLSGRVITDNRKNAWFLTWESEPDNLERTALSFNNLSRLLGNIRGEVIVFMDTHASTLRPRYLNQLIGDHSNVVVLSSFGSNDYRKNRQEWQGGLFTQALIEGMKGGADYSGTGAITIPMLNVYIAEKLKLLCRNGENVSYLSMSGYVAAGLPVLLVN